ncbi:aspartic protease [Aphelenchoides avenae]|nr:aspartic protease [Aphelenchus avenae]
MLLLLITLAQNTEATKMRALLPSLIFCLVAFSIASGHDLAAKVLSSPVHFGGQRGYYTNISIGTPPQPFRVALDIVTASLWVADSSCVEPPAPTFDPSNCPPFCKDVVYCKLCPAPCGCTNVAFDGPSLIATNDHWGYCEEATKFRSAASSTYKKDGRYFEDDSNVEADAGGDGDQAAKGFVGIDSVTLGAAGSQVTVPSNGFGQANTSTLGYFDPFDGVFGLGPAKGALSGTQSVLANAFAKGVLPEPLITIALWNYLTSNKTPVDNAGAITFGGLDPVNCGAVKKYHSIVGQTGYNLKLDGMRLGSAKSTLPVGATAKFVSGSYNLLAGSKAVIDPIAKATGAVFDEGAYFIHCNATFPSLFLTLGGADYEFPANTLIERFENDESCLLSFDVMREHDDPNAIYIGDPVHNAFCLVLDPVNARIGLATAKPRK